MNHYLRLLEASTRDAAGAVGIFALNNYSVYTYKDITLMSQLCDTLQRGGGGSP